MLSFLPNLLKRFGWNPTNKLEDVIRRVINKQYDTYVKHLKEQGQNVKELERDGRDVTFSDVRQYILCVLLFDL